MSYTIVGVIGHIDHGKTSLVAQLTGVDTDTHPEEKLRGITIDLGFASYTDGEHRFALIDAPGHQKYIGNLLAGVSAVDIGLLVVACDQGIQAQTLEHAAILQSLGVPKLIVAMSRIDLADAATRQELAEELDVFLADFGFHQIPKVSTSTVTGEGIDDLKSLLREHARAADRAAPSQFRMPIDRVFTVEGRGCVVAGTLWSGSVAVGDHVQWMPHGRSARVRELEVHGDAVSDSRAGMRTAMNLAGLSAADVVRGDELVAEGTHRPTRRLVVELAMFRDAPPLRCPCTLQLHTATTSCASRISGPKQIAAGQSAIVIVDVESPVIATYQQQCLFRKPYPVGSLAGGRILACVHPSARQMRGLLQLGQRIAEGGASDRLAAWVDFQGEMLIDPTWMELQLGIAPDQQSAIIDQCIASGLIQMPVPGRLVSAAALDRTSRFIIKLLTHQAEATDDAWLVEEAVFRRAASAGSAQVVQRVIDDLVQGKQLVRFNNMVAIASETTVLSKKQRARMDQVLSMFGDSRTPPTLKEAAAKLGTSMDNVASLIRFATQQRILIDLGSGFFISPRIFRELCGELNELFQTAPGQSVSTIRDRWQMTRKHAIPLLEYSDAIGVTIRQGDTRIAGQTLSDWLPDPSDSPPSESSGQAHREQTIE